jgi:ribosomal protein S6
MNNYELLYILPASETSEELVKTFQDVQKHIEKFGGVMLNTLLEHPFLTKTGMSKDEEPEELRVLPMVKRKLAFAIRHEKFGYYCLVNFSAEAKKIEEVDEYLRLNGQVLRHIIIQANPMSKEQLEQLQTLFARKKAEQDREEAEKESGSIKEEPKRLFKKEPVEVKTEPAASQAAPVVEEVTQSEEVKPIEAAAKEEIAKEETPAKEAEEIEEVKLEPAVKEEKKAKEEKKEEEAKEEKKAGRKSKIKLEELEDKLDEILEDTIV